MYRHHIAPSRAYTQFSHDIIRHPRLSSDAVRLLTWQLSLPEGARESLSRTAERAGIGATAFTRAKRQLKEEGFVHERRVQVPGGLWVTQQLISNVPLSSAEAAKMLARTPTSPTSPTSPQAAPSPRIPAVGAPTPRPTDGHPKKDPVGNTSHHPHAPETPAALASEAAHTREAPALPGARVLVASFPHLSPDLRHVPRAMREELTNLTARWLAAGHTPAAIRAHILRGLPADGSPVRKPGGLLRHLLRDVGPVAPEERARTTLPAPEAPASAPVPAPGPRLSARLAAMRECEGDRHIQPCLFRPVGDETLCPRCTASTPQRAADLRTHRPGLGAPAASQRPGADRCGTGSTSIGTRSPQVGRSGSASLLP